MKIGLLKNGNQHQPVKLGKQTVSVLNTCAIDAFCQSLSTAYCDSLSFQSAVNNESTNLLLQLVKSIATQGVSTNIYLKRAELLATLFPTGQLMSGALQIDAQCHVSTVIQKTMRNIASVYFHKKCSSPHCVLNLLTTREVPMVYPSFEILQTSGIAQLEIAVQQGLDQPRSLCQRPLPSASQSLPPSTPEESSGTALCEGMVTHSYSLGEVLWVDTDLMSASNSLQQKREFPLSDFPSSLVLQNKTFTLRAVIAFRGTLCKNALGHYVAYCRRPPCVWEMYDDLRKEVKTVSENTEVCSHAVLYTQEY